MLNTEKKVLDINARLSMNRRLRWKKDKGEDRWEINQRQVYNRWSSCIYFD